MRIPVIRRVLVLGCALVCAACVNLRTSIPAVDGTPPQVELQLSGPGIGNQSLTNPPRETWQGADGAQYLDLEPGATYRFALYVRDSGGVARAAISFPDDLELTHLVGDGLLDQVVGISRRLTVTGNRASPVRVLSISGRLIVPAGDSNRFDIECEADDFGGAAGPPNQRFLGVSTAYGL